MKYERKIYADDEVVTPKKFADIMILNDGVMPRSANIIKKWIKFAIMQAVCLTYLGFLLCLKRLSTEMYLLFNGVKIMPLQ